MMKKTIIKKIKDKTITPANKEYLLVMSLNDQVFSVDTDNLFEAITSLIPFQLKTRVLMTIRKGNTYCEKMLLLKEARMVFRNKVALEVFINRLIFK